MRYAFQIGFHHLGDEFFETNAVAPAKLPFRLGGVAEQQLDFGGK
jgi:hypothetical protein